MASIEKRNGQYRVRWRDDDGAHSRKAPNLKTAKDIKRQVEEAHALGRSWQPGQSGQEVGLIEIHRAYLTDQARILAPSSVRRYAVDLQIWETWLVKSKGPNPGPSLLTKKLLSEFWDYLVAERGNSKGSTASCALRTISRMWRWAFEEEDFGHLVPPPRPLKLPSAITSPTRSPTWEEMDTFIAHAEGVVRVLAIVMRFTGLRVAQAAGLLWSDLDFSLHTVTIRGVLGKSRQEKRGRLIPASPHLFAELGLVQRSGELVVGQHHNRHIFALTTRVWAATGVRTEVWKRQPHHAFRKGFVSGLKRAGADDEAVEYLVGHALGLRGHYVDTTSLPLAQAVALVPPLNRVIVGDVSRKRPRRARVGKKDSKIKAVVTATDE